MSRYYLFCSVALLCLSAFFALNPSRASESDKEKPVSALPKDEISEVAELVDRIEELEKRLSTLEGREPLIRQADSRETSNVDGSAPLPPAMTPTEDFEEDEDATQKTNGQTWRFRLLNDHRTSPRREFEKVDQRPKPVPQRSDA